MSKGDKNRTKDRDAYRDTIERIRKNEEKSQKKEEDRKREYEQAEQLLNRIIYGKLTPMKGEESKKAKP